MSFAVFNCPNIEPVEENDDIETMTELMKKTATAMKTKTTMAVITKTTARMKKVKMRYDSEIISLYAIIGIIFTMDLTIVPVMDR